MADNEEKLAGSAIPKRTIRLKPTNPAAPAAAASAPTLKLKTPAAPAPAATPAPAAANAAPVSTDTAKLARRTIKLVPQSGSPLSGPATAPATPVTPAVAPAPAAAPVSTDTAKLAKRTIKLTPASGTPGAASAPSAPTIKLHSPAAASAPSAPTIKLHSPAAASAPSAPTIKLTNPQPAAAESEVPTDTAQITRQPATPSSPSMGETVKLRPQSQQTIRLTPSAGGLQLKKPVEKTGLAATEAPKELTNKLKQEKAAEKSPAAMMYLVSSAVALLLIGFTCFIMFAQYSNFFSGTNINVPGVERQTGSTSGN